MVDKKKKDERRFDDVLHELEALAESLESETADVEEGVQKFERGLMLIAELKKRLQKTENVVRELKTRYRDVLSAENSDDTESN